MLKGLPAAQLNLTMHGISAQLGVDCVHCHIWEEFDKDAKPAKMVARRMITMVRDLNQQYFNGAQVVTCYTCHRGSPLPVTTMLLPDTISLRKMTEAAPPLPVEEEIPVKPTYPAADAILAKYVQALGGEAALRKVTSRVITAKRDYPTAAAGLIPVMAEVEIYQKAPNLTVMFSKGEKLDVAEGFDGQVAWAKGANGNVNNLGEPEQQRARRNADFYQGLDLAKDYEGLKVMGIEKVNGHEAYVLSGTPPGDREERLYFDVKSGLLLRRWASFPTLIADYVYAVDYDDYRKTKSGVMIPYVIRMVPSGPRNEEKTNSTLQILTVKENVEIDPTKFTKPPSKQPAGRGR
ncbi:MAG: photosynthetic reaction center cytochrome c subunit family protein, partial [Bryobacteraceae bacterium]